MKEGKRRRLNEWRYRNRDIRLGLRRFDYGDGFFLFLIAERWHNFMYTLAGLPETLKSVHVSCSNETGTMESVTEMTLHSFLLKL